MSRRHVGLALCACVILLAAGLALGRYSVLRGGVVITASGAADAVFTIGIKTREASLTPGEMGAKININSASVDELTELPGIGPALAGRIVEYREQNGDFESIEEIMAVRGIGESVFSKIREYIFIE